MLNIHRKKRNSPAGAGELVDINGVWYLFFRVHDPAHK